MKYLLAILFSFGVCAFANAQSDTTSEMELQPADQLTCAAVDSVTIACYSPSVDKDNDGKVSAMEWTEAPIEEKGIMEVDTLRSGSEVFHSDIVCADDFLEYNESEIVDQDYELQEEQDILYEDPAEKYDDPLLDEN